MQASFPAPGEEQKQVAMQSWQKGLSEQLGRCVHGWIDDDRCTDLVLPLRLSAQMDAEEKKQKASKHQN